MAASDVTASYVDLMTYNKYATRTSNSSEFDALKAMYVVYLNTNTDYLPDAKFTRGLALLIAHHYALDDTQSPDSGSADNVVGPITSEKVGQVSQVRGLQPYIGTVDGHKTWLLQTRWGTEFMYLMKTFKATPAVT